MTEFDKEKYKVWKLPNLMLLHWVVNPGLAFNELVLGQKIPKITLIDKTSDAPLMERQYVPCPHCNTLHDGRIWSKKNAFGHWFGIICPSCFEKIPNIWNITSLLLLALTSPLWFWFKKPLEKRWYQKQKHKFTQTDAQPLIEAKEVSWLGMGLFWGSIMFCIMAVPDIAQGKLSPQQIAVQAGIWFIGGLVFGLLMKLVLSQKQKHKKD